jgi:hypothetical protein
MKMKRDLDVAKENYDTVIFKKGGNVINILIKKLRITDISTKCNIPHISLVIREYLQCSLQKKKGTTTKATFFVVQKWKVP